MTTTMKKSKIVRTCRLCEAEFESILDYSLHTSRDHDLGRGRSERLPLRTVSCWACAKQIDVNVTKSCECGFSLEEHGY